jgi:pimeloyl-ACP methyl ester carboxylesterase
MFEQTPAIVLVHGAWADASGWSAVILRLQEDGFTVYAPPNPLRGLPHDSAYLHEFLTRYPALAGQPVVLAAHSYGGAVITNAAVDDPRVNALVYVDAFIPDLGETIGQLAGAQPGSCLLGNPAEIFDAVPYPGAPADDVDLYIKPGVVPGCFATGLSPAGQRLHRTVRGPGLEDHPVVGGDRHRGPGYPARRADLHGQAGRCPHHRGERRAPVHDRRPADGRPGHRASGQSDQLTAINSFDPTG